MRDCKSSSASSTSTTSSSRQEHDRHERAKANRAMMDLHIRERRMQTEQNLDDKKKRTPNSASKKKLSEQTRRPSGKKPTVPVGPQLATEVRSRSRSRGATPRERQPGDDVTMAQSDDILRKSLRDGTNSGSCNSLDSLLGTRARTKTTVGEGPKLATTKRHGNKRSPNGEDGSTKNASWENELRTPTKSRGRSKSPHHRTQTIPDPPKFHKMHQRKAPKSTEEREREMMEYYKSHPFKAKSINENVDDRPFPETPKKPTTACEPFHLKTDERAANSPRFNVKELHSTSSNETYEFKARAMPDFWNSSSSLGSIGGSSKELTLPEPFHFRTDERAAKFENNRETYRPKGSKYTPKKDEPKQFHALPMPEYTDKPWSPDHSHKKPTKPKPFQLSESNGKRKSKLKSEERSRREQEMDKNRQFRARPMPDFSKVH